MRSSGSSLLVLALGLTSACAVSAQRREVHTRRPDLTLEPQRALPFWASTELIEARCESDLLEGKRLQNAAIVSTGTIGALYAFNDLLILVSNLSNQMDLVAQVHPDENVRRAATSCNQNQRSQLERLVADKIIYDAIQNVDRRQLPLPAIRFLDKEVRAFQLMGVDKDPETRKELTKLERKIDKLRRDFVQTLQEDIRSIRVRPDQLDGLPPEFLASHPTESNGLITITTRYEDYIPIQTYARNEDVRAALAKAFFSRGHPQNSNTLRELLRARHTYATLLGFKNWADYTAQDKMLKSSRDILAFTNSAARAAQPQMRNDLRQLLGAKRRDNPGARSFNIWDLRYYLERRRESLKLKADFQAARQYFSTDAVVDGSLKLFAELFGLKITPEQTAHVWHPSVTRYRVEYDGQPLGYFFLDLYNRDDKYPGAAMFPIALGISEGQIPTAALVCNFPSSQTSDGLMEHHQVVTFFHEFGHLLHYLFARSSRWASLSGLNIEWDFVLAPAQVFEEWAWSPKVLKRFALHSRTGEPIPAELVKRLQAARGLSVGVQAMQQVFYQALSLILHTKDPADLKLATITQNVQEKYSPFPFIDDTHLYANFYQLGEYGSLMYTHQWSLARAKDILTRFQVKSLLNRRVAQRFVKHVLVPGGTIPAAKMLETFLGRKTNEEAYRAWLSPR